jgi:hypothetical protein
MLDPITLSVSVLSLAVSVATAWLTLFRGGTVRMTQPTTVFLGPGGHGDGNKVFLRTLLYATGKRGRILESMYVKVRVGEAAQNFNIWVYGDSNLARGSGLFVGAEGITCNHHFLLPKNANFAFTSTEHIIEVYAVLVGAHSPILLLRTRLTISPEQVVEMREPQAGVYFDWGPDTGGYHAHVEMRPPGAREGIVSPAIARRTSL